MCLNLLCLIDRLKLNHFNHMTIWADINIQYILMLWQITNIYCTFILKYFIYISVLFWQPLLLCFRLTSHNPLPCRHNCHFTKNDQPPPPVWVMQSIIKKIKIMIKTTTLGKNIISKLTECTKLFCPNKTSFLLFSLCFRKSTEADCHCHATLEWVANAGAFICNSCLKK